MTAPHPRTRDQEVGIRIREQGSDAPFFQGPRFGPLMEPLTP